MDRLRNTVDPCHHRRRMTPVRDLKGSRRELAIVFSEGEKTAHEAAKLLGRPTGSIFGVLQRMYGDGLLIADTDPDPPTRGTQYRLSEEGHDLLRETLPEESPGVGRLEADRRVLLVLRRGGLRKPAKVLASSTSAGLIEWGAELPGSGWLLTTIEDPDGHRLDALVAAFEKADCDCHLVGVGSLHTGTALRNRAASLIGSRG
jgi:hypothetical protein